MAMPWEMDWDQAAGASPSAPDDLLAAVEWQESRGNQNAISPKGARGVMQLMPGTMADPGFGVRPLDPNAADPVAENRRLGGDYLSAMLNRYGGDKEAALVAYNWGPGNADRWLQGGKKGRLPAETQSYVRNILGTATTGEQRGVDIDPSAPRLGAMGQPLPWEMEWGADDSSQGGTENTVENGGADADQPSNLFGDRPDDPEGTAAHDAWVQGAAQGLLLNFGDEAASGIQTGGGLWGDYGRTLEENRATMERAYAKHPWIFTAGQLLGGAAFGAGLAKSGLSLTANAAQAGSPLLRRIVPAMAEGGAIGALYGAGSGEGSDRAAEAAKGAGVGAVAGPLVEAGGAALRRMLGRQLPEPQAKAAVNEAQQFQIPLTRGQATGNVSQQALEEAARHDAKGIMAGRILRGMDARQAQAVQEAKRGIQQDLAGQRTLIESPAEAGAAVASSMQSRAQGLRDTGNAAYESAFSADLRLKAEALPALSQRVNAALEPWDTLVSPQNTPITATLKNIIDRFTTMEHVQGGKPVAVSLQGLERVRQMVNRAKANLGTQDATTLRDLKGAFDDWLEDTVDRSLYSGDPAAFQTLKKARGLWAQYLGMTRPKKGDDAGLLISKMATQDVTPVEVSNWLFGASNVGGAGRPVRLVNRLAQMFGPNSDEMSALRQAMWMKLNFAPEGKDMPGPQLVSQRLGEFLGGKGGDLARSLYTPQQLAKLRAFQGVLKRLAANPHATNPSKSGYTVTRLLGDAWANSMAALGFVGGGLETAIVMRLGVPLFREGHGALRAMKAVNRPVPKISGPARGRAAYSGVIADQARQYIQAP